MTRTRVRWGRVSVLVAALTLVLGLGSRALGGTTERPPSDSIVVRPGQTLWEIARARVGPEGDPRPLIAEIREASGLRSSALRPGQVLRIPPLS